MRRLEYHLMLSDPTKPLQGALVAKYLNTCHLHVQAAPAEHWDGYESQGTKPACFPARKGTNEKETTTRIYPCIPLYSCFMT